MKSDYLEFFFDRRSDFADIRFLLMFTTTDSHKLTLAFELKTAVQGS